MSHSWRNCLASRLREAVNERASGKVTVRLDYEWLRVGDIKSVRIEKVGNVVGEDSELRMTGTFAIVN